MSPMATAITPADKHQLVLLLGFGKSLIAP